MVEIRCARWLACPRDIGVCNLVVNLLSCAIYLEAQNQEKGFGFWCGFSPRLCFPAHWAFAWWGRVILEVQHLVPQWEHTGGFHNVGEQTEECFTEEVRFTHLLNFFFLKGLMTFSQHLHCVCERES